MLKILAKIKNISKKALLLGSLFLSIFLALFYAANFDVQSLKKSADDIVSQQSAPDINQELRKRLGSTTISIESYQDWAKRFGLDLDKGLELDADPDKEGLPNYLEYVHGTDPLKADSDGDKFTDKQEIANGYDPDAPGDAKPMVMVYIDKLTVNAPMIWSLKADEKSMLKDLESGLSHYPKSASPGQNGNMVVSGHSSNYVWAKGNFNHVFKDLNNLENGDEVIATVIQKNGRVVSYHYKVSEKFITIADDERIFAETPVPSLTLSTCWPIGTNYKRAIIKADLVK